MSIPETFGIIAGTITAIAGLSSLIGYIIGLTIGNKIKQAMLEIQDDFVKKETCKAIREDCHRLHDAKFVSKS